MATIRLLRKHEAQQVVDVLRKCFHSPTATASTVALCHSIVYVAEIDGKIVGTVSLTVTSEFAYIDDLAVLPTYQHQGIATQLVQAALRIADQNSAETYAVCANPYSAKIFQHLGFCNDGHGKFTKKTLDLLP